MASDPITSWQIDGGEMETVADFIFLSSKISADGAAAMKLKMLATWKKSYDKSREGIKRQRHNFANKSPSSQAIVFAVVMYGCESWTIKKSECQKIDAFQTVVQEKTLEGPLD